MRTGCSIVALILALIGGNLFYNSFAHRTGDIADIEWRWVGILLMSLGGLTIGMLGVVLALKKRKDSWASRPRRD